MKAGTYTQLRADLDPKPHMTSDLEWFSTNPDVASVDEFGIVRAKEVGSAAIVVMDTESRKYTACNLTVTASA